MLAGVSVDYYTRLERGNAAGVSDTVLEALSPGRCSSTRPSARTSSTSRARAQTSPPRRRAARAAADPADACSTCSTR